MTFEDYISLWRREIKLDNQQLSVEIWTSVNIVKLQIGRQKMQSDGGLLWVKTGRLTEYELKKLLPVLTEGLAYFPEAKRRVAEGDIARKSKLKQGDDENK